jgi:hypothetical protein
MCVCVCLWNSILMCYLFCQIHFPTLLRLTKYTHAHTHNKELKSSSFNFENCLDFATHTHTHIHTHSHFCLQTWQHQVYTVQLAFFLCQTNFLSWPPTRFFHYIAQIQFAGVSCCINRFRLLYCRFAQSKLETSITFNVCVCCMCVCVVWGLAVLKDTNEYVDKISSETIYGIIGIINLLRCE